MLVPLFSFPVSPPLPLRLFPLPPALRNTSFSSSLPFRSLSFSFILFHFLRFRDASVSHFFFLSLASLFPFSFCYSLIFPPLLLFILFSFVFFLLPCPRNISFSAYFLCYFLFHFRPLFRLFFLHFLLPSFIAFSFLSFLLFPLLLFFLSCPSFSLLFSSLSFPLYYLLSFLTLFSRAFHSFHPLVYLSSTSLIMPSSFRPSLSSPLSFPFFYPLSFFLSLMPFLPSYIFFSFRFFPLSLLLFHFSQTLHSIPLFQSPLHVPVYPSLTHSLN